MSASCGAVGRCGTGVPTRATIARRVQVGAGGIATVLSRATVRDTGAAGWVALQALAAIAGSGQTGRATHVGSRTTAAVQTGRAATTTGRPIVTGAGAIGVLRTTNGFSAS